MDTIFWICIVCFVLILAYLIIGIVYTMIVTYKQTKKFVSQLNVGDETIYGKVSEIEGEYVIINQAPLKLHKNELRPARFNTKNAFFLFR